MEASSSKRLEIVRQTRFRFDAIVKVGLRALNKRNDLPELTSFLISVVMATLEVFSQRL